MATDTPTTPAEQITALLDQLYDHVETREKIPHYRQVRRASERTVAVLDWAVHVTKEPGLLVQLGVIRSRLADGVVIPGSAVPGGSPGWDADGALAPIVGGGKPDAAEPIADAWHVAADINTDVNALVAELRAEGRTGGLVDIALNDERTGRRIAARLAGLVARARIAADYDAPIVPLKDIVCPECGGELRVREDASSPVWCAGRWTVEGPAWVGEAWPVGVVCGARWPRGAWVQLLEETDTPEPVQAVRGVLGGSAEGWSGRAGTIEPERDEDEERQAS